MHQQSPDTGSIPEQPLIRPQPPAADRERVARIFEAVESRLGFVPDGLRLYSLSPPLLEAFLGNVTYFNEGGTALSPALTAMIRYLVSWDSGCRFCVDFNEALLERMGHALEAVRAARDDPEQAPLEVRERALLALALRAVTGPETVTADDLDALRAQGWGDRELFDAVAQAASNRAFNLVLRTFKVEHQGALA